MSSRNYHIDASLDGASLSQAIKQLVTNTSWSAAKKLIANRHVQIHGNLCLDEGRRLKEGDVIKVWAEPLGKPPAANDLMIVYRDAHLIVIDKPAGITTQREAREISAGRNQKQATLDELVQQAIARLPRIESEPVIDPIEPKPKLDDFIVRRRAPVERAASRKPAPIKVRPVHRLDRDTSGLILFALSPEAEQKLASMFKAHTIQRAYRAVVVGNLRGPMTIESDIARDRGDGLRGSSDDPKAPERQHAVTHVRLIEHIGDDYTIVECRLETGRTHQIRIHLAERGHMLCGEKTYTKPLDGKPVKDDSEAPRHALHSATLAFAHPIGGTPMKFESPWPRDLARWLERLKA
jgi:23S rRNA pseudouridine1911/1915/1917 synthase